MQRVLRIALLPLSVKHKPLHHRCFVVTLSPCNSKRRKSFLMTLVPRSLLTRSCLQRQVAHANNQKQVEKFETRNVQMRIDPMLPCICSVTD